METFEKTTALDAVSSEILFAHTPDGKIAYRSAGSGQPMILCARFRGNLDSWDPGFLAALAKNYRVITFDYSGLGSSTGTAPSNVLAFANNVRDLAQALDLEKIIVGGWSLGGFVSAIVMTEYPELVSHNIMIGTKPPGANEHDMEQIFLDTAYKPYYDLEDETILFFEPTSEVSREAARLSHERMKHWASSPDLRIPEEFWNNYMLCGADYAQDVYKSRDKFSTTSIPVLVISADHEICFPPENWFALNRRLPTTQLIVIPESGHGVQHQYPDLVAEYITSFISSNL
ncbi:alpha/beta fold hydrolase [Dyadobacter psychrotolerans]|uniref:Alpha/beta hydrolase n=1 Tax=Dyadobacter psychrotolerans TaxID=2541721 RepID=A0A4R5DFQ3_9BACT|nr:alpha/beta hydrolase [Dyadobacter psychrotolerans]TDE10790.1 alpha/beta hydrolase [Dyadobacter psychrotolerans]